MVEFNSKLIVNWAVIIVSVILALAGLYLIWPGINAILHFEIMDGVWFFVGTAACWALAALLYSNKETIINKVP